MATKRSSSSSSSGSRTPGKVQNISRAHRGGDRSSSGRGKIDNVTYDVIAVMHEKSQGLEAYDQYLQDARNHDQVREVLEEIRQQDEEAVQRLMECLRELVSGEREEEEEEAA
ncbi:MAG: hypothetical protein JWN45_1154 [Acidobacteriaceae bacterium]|nr:hypothetical protein [Acidobacteriaceae bacterium]